MKTMLLNGIWHFITDEKNTLLNSESYKNKLQTECTALVPSPIQDLEYLRDEFPSVAMNNAYLGTAWYETEFEIKKDDDEYVLLKFDGVCPYATVYINGNKVGEITNPHTAHSFFVTDFVNNKKNRLTVIIEEKNTELLGGLRFDVLNWSGIYGDVILISDKKVLYSDDFVFTDIEKNIFTVGCKVETDYNLEYIIKILDNDTEKCIMESKANLNGDIVENEFSLNTMKLWSTDTPYLYKAEIVSFKDKEALNSHSFTFGLRELETSKTRIYVNKKPTYIFGGGEEYFSVDISPLKDREIIRNRFKRLKELGFNFFRYHTHIPTIEEIEEADKIGIMLSAEIPVLSNFNRITDEEKGLEILKNYINQTKAHPSLTVYCLGNEGAQLLVREKDADMIAKKGYDIIKENTKNQFGMICFGFQGETTHLKNDIWSPHIWSQDFRWAYQGLTQTPWDFLDSSIQNNPCVIHEYGKYGIWPDEKLDEYIRKTGYRLSIKELNDSIFKESPELYALMPQILANSRKLSLECAKISFEAMRRKDYICGYVYWTIFYMGARISGFCDDYGNECFFDPKILREGANSPLGIFIDKDFKGRTYYSSQKDKLKITVSNFSEKDVENACIICNLSDKNGVIYSFTKDNVSAYIGESKIKAEFEYIMPYTQQETEFTIEFSLNKDGKILCRNTSKVWCYPIKRAEMKECSIMHIKDSGLKNNICSCVDNITDIWNYISVVLGCVIPECGFEPSDDKIKLYIENAFKKRKPSFMITDVYDETAEIMIKNNIPVFFIDSGNFPKSFYPEKIPANNKFFDLNTFYTPFRSGWDEGNAATIIKANSYFCENQEDTYGDLRYFEMIDGSMPLLTKEVIKACDIKETDVQFRVIQKIKDMEKVEGNISVYFEKIQPKKINDCFYFIKGKINNTPCIISSCNFFKDANGRYIFTKIMECFPNKNK